VAVGTLEPVMHFGRFLGVIRQRRLIIQPRVARNELPWVNHSITAQP
jgi:hypothetical protein